jgi:uncharacterized protein YjbJ (UPF0337 family)
MTEENEEIEKTKINHNTENVESVGQMIIGRLEQVGGILTGDPMTRAEGEFNAQVGSLHQETNKNLTAIDEITEAEDDRLK